MLDNLAALAEMTSPATYRRIRVLRLRLRLEQIAGEVSGGQGTNHVASRLACAHLSRDAGLEETHRRVRIAQDIYSKACDVLHGRMSMLNLSDALLHEWEDMVGWAEELSTKPTTTPSAAADLRDQMLDVRSNAEPDAQRDSVTREQK